MHGPVSELSMAPMLEWTQFMEVIHKTVLRGNIFPSTYSSTIDILVHQGVSFLPPKVCGALGAWHWATAPENTGHY